jgi:4-aminobutyrate aminotransferase-like enzyme
MPTFGRLLPQVHVPLPGPRSRELATRLARVESRNVTWIGERFPVFWEAARGANVRDVDGNVYVDLTSAFGVALPGHADARIRRAIKVQSERLIHGMGDVHPSDVKVQLLERLAALAPWPDARAVLASSGAEAVEIALKTALLRTGRPGILAFEGGYHGLTLGALATTSRDYFRAPFQPRLFEGVSFAPFPDPRDGEDGVKRALDVVEQALGSGAREHPVGAVIVEPVQARAGVRVPPSGFFPAVMERARAAGALVIADEVFTGAGRCGAFLASPAMGLDPDVVCMGKALSGGLPFSACIGRADVMEAWPASPGEALHTSTFLGHPIACAAALAAIGLLEEGIAERAQKLGESLLKKLRVALRDAPGVGEVRGLGLLLGIELIAGRKRRSPRTGAATRIAEDALAKGLLVLPAGDRGHVVELAPPACLTRAQLDFAVEALACVVQEGVGAADD